MKHRNMRVRWFGAVALFVVALLTLGAPPAAAHAEFVSAAPSDGSQVVGVIHEIELTYSGEVEPAGAGFEVLDPNGSLRIPDSILSDDGMTWRLTFNEPMSMGVWAIRWEVAAPDAHPISGSFTFQVVVDEADGASPSPAGLMPDTPIDVADFLEGNGEAAFMVGLFGALARTVSIGGALLAVGGVIFAALVMRGSESDIRSVLFWVRRASVLLGVGAGLELAHQIAVARGDWLVFWPDSTTFGVLASSFGLAILLRIAGAMLISTAHLEVVPASHVKDPVVAIQSSANIGAGPKPEPPHRFPYDYSGDRAWKVTGGIGLVSLGIFVVLTSYVFDGHTVTEGIRGLTALVDMAHVAAGSVWAGGLVMLVHVVWLRHRRGSDLRALQLAVRFSVVAAGALVVAGIAGAGLTVIVLDEWSELWTTTWGRVLLAKLVVVAAAAAAGGYNHKVLIPEMIENAPDDPVGDARFRRAVTYEGIAMGLILLLTAVLVGSGV